MLKNIQNFLEPVIAFALPALCLNCREVLDPNRKIICEECFNKIHPLGNHWIGALKTEIVPNYFDDLYILFEFDSIFQNLIHLFKYQRATSLAFYFAEKLAKQITRKYDFITAVPLNPVRQKERGYNQSFLIADGIHRLLDIPIHSELLKRTRNTSTQTKLTKSQRIKNVAEAFIADPLVNGKTILLVDDVITTGSTLNECARVLKKTGAALTDIAALATPVNSDQNYLEQDAEKLQS